MTEPSIVLELQQLALEPSADIVDLLRKTRFAAMKLEFDELASWAAKELDGYTTHADVPPYRWVPAVMRANYGSGWMDYDAKDPEFRKLAARKPILDRIAAVAESAQKREPIILPLPPEAYGLATGGGILALFTMPRLIALHIGAFEFGKIVERVREIVLDWSLQLEKTGVLGQGFTFTPGEVGRASDPSLRNIVINSMIFNKEVGVAHMEGSTGDVIKAESGGVAAKGAIVNYRAKLDSVTQTIQAATDLSDKQKSELTQYVDTLKRALEAIREETKQERANDIEILSNQLDSLVKAASQPAPNRNKTLLQITGEGLKEAAKAIADIAPDVLRTATLIAATVLS